jgi:N-acetylglucosaminyldiphosphoundecaprenol N-acetyl-beta-D-mannosaminyltransferase
LAADGLSIAYTGPGYFATGRERQATIRSILRSRARIVIAGLGAPRQERYLLELREAGFRGAAFTCGGYLDQIVRRGVKYYPDAVERLNLRFLQRLLDQPTKMTARYVIEYAPFYACLARRRLGLVSAAAVGSITSA